MIEVNLLPGAKKKSRKKSSSINFAAIGAAISERFKDKYLGAAVLPQDTVQFRIVGRTVDIQAFTRFMRTLEDSPFIQNVNMEKTEVAVEGGKDITQFTLNMTYARPDSLLLRRVPFTLATPTR